VSLTEKLFEEANRKWPMTNRKGHVTDDVRDPERSRSWSNYA